MADLLVRNLEPVVITRLKLRAKRHRRSLQGELKYIIESITKFSMEEAKKTSALWHNRLSGNSFTDSATLLRKDRDH